MSPIDCQSTAVLQANACHDQSRRHGGPLTMQKRIHRAFRARAAFAARCPAATRMLQRLQDRYRRLQHGGRYMEEIFSRIYRDDIWRDGESLSGWGSTLEQTEILRSELPGLLSRLGVKSLLDAPCG